MSSITNSNINSAIVNVGRTTPVVPGAQPASKSIPVVMASDQTSIPVEEQNKIQSEVALSLLGIPRAEIALGIFADVNTYDVNPSEWSMKPAYHIGGDGVKHLPTEAGALVEASRNKVSVLTSKRFFRYQPGRVSAATFGIKSSVSVADYAQNPVIRKYGIYDKYDGYYWETRNSGKEDNFGVVRRTQSLQYGPVSPFGTAGVTTLRGQENQESIDKTALSNTQLDDYRIVGMGKSESVESEGLLASDRKALADGKFELIQAALDYVVGDHANHLAALPGSSTSALGNVSKGWTASKISTVNISGTNTSYYADLATAFNASVGYVNLLTAAQMEAKCKRDLEYWIDMFLLDMEYGGDAHTRWNSTNFSLADETAGNEWSTPLHDVGVFPKISAFEAPLHNKLLELIDANTVVPLSSSGENKVKALQTLVATSFGNSQGNTVSAWDDDFDVMSVAEGQINYGTRDPLETFFEVKRNFWSYFVTTKKEPITLESGTVLEADKKYTIKYIGVDPGTSLNANQNAVWIEAGAQTVNDDVWNGKVFSGSGLSINVSPIGGLQVYETITYTPASFGNSSTDTSSGTNIHPLQYLNQGGRLGEIEDVLQNKCQRDVGYVVDGYKNDILGGGNAETTYNASMFMRGTGMSVYSQKNADGTLSEISRHSYLRTLIKREMKAFDTSFNNTLNYNDVHGGSSNGGSFTELANLIVNNFSNENTKALQQGSRAFPGNLVVLRDGLIHTHAAVYDPSLLKDAEKIKAIATNGVQNSDPVQETPNIFTLTKGNVTFGQHVKIYWDGTEDSVDILSASIGSDGVGVKIYKGEILRVKRVLGPKGNQFTATRAVREELQGGGRGFRQITIDLNAADFATKVDTFRFELVCPFAFPLDYDFNSISPGEGGVAFNSEIDTTYATLNNDGSDSGATGLSSARIFRQFANINFETKSAPLGGMFPYMYATNDDLRDNTMGANNEYVGFINTALELNEVSGTNINTFRSQIDNVNFYPEYVNWIKNNVKPEYWGVYEYRVPRSRFSHDALDGIKDNADDKDTGSKGKRKRVYSDLATGLNEEGVNTIARPGQNFFEIIGVPQYQNSEYDFDFTKVTMLKVEFSWYGAVGALFLAYIPVSNGEARWVRVHHLRASNQLKIASLGNATLPITYTTYGGGSTYCLGDGEDNTIEQGYGTFSHNIVKYGASYYIDGGDRGTVRLYSHNNDDTVNAVGKRFAAGTGPSVSAKEIIQGSGPQTPFIPNDSGTASAEFFMGATIKTNNPVDSNIKVIWVDDDNDKLYLSSEISTTAGLKVLPDRASNVFGIETKKTILSTREQNAVRNRVQVYPTKLSSANIGTNPVRLRFKKTPLFQTDFVPTVPQQFILNADHTIDNTNAPLSTSTAGYMANGDESYGWFRARIGAEFLSVFGRLYKDAENYYFELLESYEGTVILVGSGTSNTFLRDKKYDSAGAEVTTSTSTHKFLDEKEGLSSVVLATNIVVPIPNTGVNVATTYLRPGTEQFDLSTYFDYNKEYLSFPLTDIADTLYFSVDSDQANSTTDAISLGVTWEEQ